MTIEQAIVEKIRTLPVEKQQAVRDFVEFLRQKSMPKPPRRNPMGLFADLHLDITDEDVAEARREMWGGFPRDVES